MTALNPVTKIKTFFNDRELLKQVQAANDEHVVKPFLHGSQLKTRKFGNYLFAKNSVENSTVLKSRDFVDFKEIEKSVSWTLEDDIFKIGDQVLYNKPYNMLIVMVSEKIWDNFNKAVNIGKKTKTDLDTQREIIINAFKELTDK